MRVLVWLIVPVAALSVCGAPAQAQTYDPAFPVCLQTYGIDGGYVDCSYTSIGPSQT